MKKKRLSKFVKIVDKALETVLSYKKSGKKIKPPSLKKFLKS